MKKDSARIQEMVGMMNGKMPVKKKVKKYVDDEEMDKADHEESTETPEEEEKEPKAVQDEEEAEGEEPKSHKKKGGLFGRAGKGIGILIGIGKKK